MELRSLGIGVGTRRRDLLHGDPGFAPRSLRLGHQSRAVREQPPHQVLQPLSTQGRLPGRLGLLQLGAARRHQLFHRLCPLTLGTRQRVAQTGHLVWIWLHARRLPSARPATWQQPSARRHGTATRPRDTVAVRRSRRRGDLW